MDLLDMRKLISQCTLANQKYTRRFSNVRNDDRLFRPIKRYNNTSVNSFSAAGILPPFDMTLFWFVSAEATYT